jgi:hypothetical protein
MQKTQGMVAGAVFSFGILVGAVFGVLNMFTPLVTWILLLFGAAIGVFLWRYGDGKQVLFASLVLVVIGQFGPNALINANTMLNVLNGIMLVFLPVSIICAARIVFEMKKS